MDQKINAGYIITDTISFNGHIYVLGHNPKERAAFVTWEQIGENSYARGHYLQTEADARQDLFLRALNRMPQSERDELILAAMSDDLRLSIEEELDRTRHLTDIEFCLYPALESLGIDSSYGEQLLHDESFCQKALHVYYRQDHSYENEALSESLENLLEEQYSTLIPKNFTAVLKISPEEMDLINDVLSLTQDQAAEKYGPFESGEGLLRFSKEIASPRGNNAYMDIEIHLKEQEGAANIELYLYSSETPAKTDPFRASLQNVTNFEQIYSVTDNKGQTWRVDLHADERLRRIGKDFVFRTDHAISPGSELALREGKPCTVERMLTKKENYMLTGSLMWRARFEDGTILDVFDSELTLPYERKMDLTVFHPAQQKPIQGTPLDDLIAGAKAVSKPHDTALPQVPNLAEPLMDR